jgi:AcrR family transcriptional regulator
MTMPVERDDVPHTAVMAPGLRELKKQRTRQAIQEAALELIKKHGYDATTCEQVAAAAGVSPATFFRYFPTKEDVVLQDDYDPLMSQLVATRPAEEPPVTAVRRALADALGGLDDEEWRVVRERSQLLQSVPALRARSLEQLMAARAALAEALAPRMHKGESDLEVSAIAAACAGAMAVAVEHWTDHGGDLAEYVDRAISVLE